MSKATQVLRATPILLSAALVAPMASQAEMMDETFWSSAEPGTAWVTSYGECWNSKGGPDDLAPCVQPVPEEFVVRLNFEFDKYRLENIVNDQELGRLDSYIDNVNATTTEEYLTVVGHTDAKGSDEYNMELGERRAETVRDYMISRGIPETLVAPAQSRGESDMLPDYSPYALEQRRVVIRSEG